MAIKIKQYDENSGGGTGGSGGSGVGTGGGTGGSGGGTGGGGLDNTNVNTYLFTLTANIEGFTTTINGDVQATPQSVRITKDSLINKPKKIEITKKGYTAEECYIISMIDDDVPIINNGSNKLGLNQKVVQLQKYNGDVMVGPPLPLLGGAGTLIFTLNQAIISDEPTIEKIKFNISGDGAVAPVSIIKNGSTKLEFFPSIGLTTYRDVSGTVYKIKSADPLLYRITNMVISKLGNIVDEFNAEPNESLESTITLTTTFEVSITTESVKEPITNLNPIISLVNDDPRKYNINEKTGVPLLIRKNKDVQAITIIIGDDIMEFDELDDASIIGLTIPENVFKKIGQYKIKLFPFSFEDYENSIVEDEEVVNNVVEDEEVTIIPQKLPKPIVEEEIVIPDELPEDIYNPYNPITINNGNSGQGQFTQDGLNTQITESDINGGSVSDKPITNTVYR